MLARKEGKDLVQARLHGCGSVHGCGRVYTLKPRALPRVLATTHKDGLPKEHQTCPLLPGVLVLGMSTHTSKTALPRPHLLNDDTIPAWGDMAMHSSRGCAEPHLELP